MYSLCGYVIRKGHPFVCKLVQLSLILNSFTPPSVLAAKSSLSGFRAITIRARIQKTKKRCYIRTLRMHRCELFVLLNVISEGVQTSLFRPPIFNYVKQWSLWHDYRTFLTRITCRHENYTVIVCMCRITSFALLAFWHSETKHINNSMGMK